jgi:hypothetical protein
VSAWKAPSDLELLRAVLGGGAGTLVRVRGGGPAARVVAAAAIVAALVVVALGGGLSRCDGLEDVGVDLGHDGGSFLVVGASRMRSTLGFTVDLLGPHYARGLRKIVWVLKACRIDGTTERRMAIVRVPHAEANWY